MAEPNEVQRAALRRSLVALIISLGVMEVLLFVPAGTLRWARGWIFGIAFAAASLIMVAAIWRLNPEIFVARSRVQPGTKTLDYLFITIILGGLIFILPVAGLDFRFGWAQTPGWVVGLGYVLFALSFAGAAWPVAVNRYFEPGIRVQADRGQTVVDTGPYAIVRHPGYVSAAVLAISMALCLGSWWALVPALVAVIGLVPRTLFEERVLTAELPGYRAYKDDVKYRWVPGVW